MPNDERRRHERHDVVRDCKIRTHAGPVYSIAQTTNISRSGALVRVASARTFGQGDPIDVALPDGVPIVTTDALIPARVRRVTPIDHHHQALGIEFDTPLSEARVLAA